MGPVVSVVTREVPHLDGGGLQKGGCRSSENIAWEVMKEIVHDEISGYLAGG